MQTEATLPLAGRTALVTGGARRVGAAIVRDLHAAGAQMVVHYHRSGDEAAALVAELQALRPGSARALQADLLDVATLPRLIADAAQFSGRLDLLVNNASSFYATPLGQITIAQWDDLLGTNLRAPLFLAQAAAPLLRANQGLIVNLVDIHGMRPLPDYTVYSLAKAGLIMLTRALARELAPDVRVNAIAPGPVMWPEAGMDEQRQRAIVDRTLLKRAGSPEDIAKAIRYFAIDGTYVTGQILAVDGGRSTGW